MQQVFPQLYLPVMEESNNRVLRPHRKYLPTPRCVCVRVLAAAHAGRCARSALGSFGAASINYPRLLLACRPACPSAAGSCTAAACHS